MTPGLGLRAFTSYGRDLTGAAYGAGVVRFVGGSSAGAENRNILGTLTRSKESGMAYSHVLVEGRAKEDNGSEVVEGDPVYVWVVAPGWTAGDPIHQGFLQYDSSNLAILERRGERYIRRSRDRSERMISCEVMPGQDEAKGLYLPGDASTDRGNYWIGDTATFKTGAGNDLDLNNTDLQIAKIRMRLDTASRSDTDQHKERSWHTEIETGDDVAPSSSADSALNDGRVGGGRKCRCLRPCGPGEIAGEVILDSHANELSFGYLDPATGDEVEVWHDTGLGATDPITRPGIQTWYMRDHSCDFLFTSDDPTHCRITRHTDGRLYIKWLDGEIDCSRPPGTGAAPGVGDGSFNNLGIALSGESSLHPDLVGTGNAAARCGHGHVVFRAVDPTEDDDSSQGYSIGTLWIVPGGGAWALADATAGAAVWQEIGPTTIPNAEDIPFTPAGSIAATDVQAAIEEVASEAASGFAGFSDHSETNTQIDTTAAAGSITVLHTRTLTSLAAGTYMVEAELYQQTVAAGSLRIRTSAPVTIQDDPSHASGTNLKQWMGRFVHAGGTVTLEIVHASEGASCRYGIGTDWRFGRRLNVWRVS
jgi:hypothetical protein